MIVGALLARNEAGPDRYLERVLRNALSFCDALVVVDDHSEDDTVEIVKKVCAVRNKPVTVIETNHSSGFWGSDEAPARAQLWEAAAEAAGPDGWIYVFDADHELVGITPAELRTLTRSSICNTYVLPLWDCWDSDELMRVDGYWQAHLHPRPWFFKAYPSSIFRPVWKTHGLHVGHYPANYPFRAAKMPGMAAIRHLGYISPKHRKKKHRNYLRVPGLNDFQRAHAQSIMEASTLVPIPPRQRPKVLVASIVRKPQVVVDALLTTLRHQIVDADISYQFVANYAEGEPIPVFGDLPVAHVAAPPGDYGDGPLTRSWSESAFGRVAQLKDTLIEQALKNGFDYLWLVDADVFCDRYTLQSALDCEAPIVSSVYWTQWQLPSNELKSYVHAGPQVWQRGVYDMTGRVDEAEFRARLLERSRMHLPEGGLGACTLIRRDAMEKGARFAFFRKNPMGFGGMAEGEDRHFCARAHALHLALVADAWPDVFHAYHVQHYARIPEMLERLGRLHPETAQRDDLVSITVELVEPVRVGGRLLPVSKRWVRGEVGKLPVLPQVREALVGMERGDARLLRVHFPLTWPAEELRGETRILRLCLLDIKPFGYPPTIEDELLRGTGSRAAIDTTTLTPAQLKDFFDDNERAQGSVGESSEGLAPVS